MHFKIFCIPEHMNDFITHPVSSDSTSSDIRVFCWCGCHADCALCIYSLYTVNVFKCLQNFITCSKSFFHLSCVARKAEQMTFLDGNSTQGDRRRPMKLTILLIDQQLAVLIRLKLGLFLQDVADRFSMSTSVFSNIFVTWISLLYEELKLINMLPSRALVTETTPLSFKCFPNLRIILDCTEIYVQRSADLICQNLLYSNYKNHTTF